MVNFLIIGAGIVGQATGKTFLDKDHEVVFVDVDTKKIQKLRDEGYSAITPRKLASQDADAVMICVSTPMKRNGGIDLKNVVSSVKTIGMWLKERAQEDPLIVVRSTVPPYTNRDKLIPLLEEVSSLKAGLDFKLCYQPEFLRADSSLEDSMNPWAIVIGEYSESSGDRLESIYRDFISKSYRVDIETAELIKYISNSFNALKISFSNEIWLLGMKLGLDSNLALAIASNVAEGYWNSGYGTVGGRPYGGSCLPKDVSALFSLAESIGIDMPMLKATMMVNSAIEHLVSKNIAFPAVENGLKWKPSPALAGKNGLVGVDQ